MEPKKMYRSTIFILLTLTNIRPKGSVASPTTSGVEEQSICQLNPCSVAEQSASSFKTPAGSLRNIYIRCSISVAAASINSCHLPIEQITDKIDSKFAAETVITQFLFDCPKENKLKVIFSKSSNKKMMNMISYLVLNGCDVMLENIGLLGTVVDLRVLYIIDFTDWINEQFIHVDSMENATSFTTVSSVSVSNKPFAPIPGLEHVGSLILKQTTNNNISIPLALYNCFWPVMAEITLTNLAAHKGAVNTFKSSMPKLQELNLDGVNFSEIPVFPWCRNSLNLPRELIRSKEFNIRYGRGVLEVKPKLYLRSLTLSGTTIGSLVNVTFNGELYMIDLSKGRISNVDSGTFNNITGLQWLNLKDNLLSDLPDGAFENLSLLKRLDLSFNSLVSLRKDIFLGLKKLTVLLLNNNNVASLGHTTFCPLNSLNRLDLSNNNVSSASPDAICNNMENLTEIDMSNNELLHFPIWVFATKSLKNVDLSGNMLCFDSLKGDFNIGEMQEIFEASTSVIQHFKPAHVKQVILHRNNFSTLSLKNDSEMTIRILSTLMSFFELDITDNEIICDCDAYSFSQFFKTEKAKVVKDFNEPKVLEYYFESWKCSKPDSAKGLPIIDAPTTDFYCEKDLKLCPQHCTCYEREVDQSVFVNCSGRELTTFPKYVPERTDTLYLNNNKLTSISKVNYLSKLKLLDLSHNTLKVISDDVVSLLDNISNVYLHDNEIQYLPSTFTNLKHVMLSLGNNILICDCNSKWLVQWLNSYKNHITDIGRITCDSGKLRSQIIYKTNENDFICDFSNIFYRNVAIALGIFIVTLILVTILVYRFRGEIKVFLYFRFNLHPFDNPDDSDVINKLYDAFISYSRADVKWVLNSLCPALETRDRPYRLCIHERDFEGGGLITDNILYSVKYSRRMIMVLTRDFIKSQWCRLEFKSAHERVLKDRTNYLIVILFDDISIDELDEDMKLYLRTNTYIEYNSSWFWQRLFYALPKKPLLHLREDHFPSKGFETLFPLPTSVVAMQKEHNLKLKAKGQQPIEIVLDREIM